MNLFGSKKKATSPRPRGGQSTQESIQRLNEALENLEKRERHIAKRVEKEQGDAKKLIAAKNKNGALMALKRKKMYEGQLVKINGTRMTIENQRMALENANFNQEVMSAMAQGANALQNVNNNMTIDRVDETMDNIQEQMDVANEISEAISQPTGMGYEDEDELEAELAELEAEGLDETFLNVENAPAPVASEPVIAAESFPSAPEDAVQLSAEEEELRQLEASMAIPS